MTRLRILKRFCPARALSCKITVRNIALERPVIPDIRWLSWRNWIVNICLIKESSGTKSPFQKFVKVWWHYLFMSRRSHSTDFQGQVFRSVTKLQVLHYLQRSDRTSYKGKTWIFSKRELQIKIFRKDLETPKSLSWRSKLSWNFCENWIFCRLIWKILLIIKSSKSQLSYLCS